MCETWAGFAVLNKVVKVALIQDLGEGWRAKPDRHLGKEHSRQNERPVQRTL